MMSERTLFLAWKDKGGKQSLVSDWQAGHV